MKPSVNKCLTEIYFLHNNNKKKFVLFSCARPHYGGFGLAIKTPPLHTLHHSPQPSIFHYKEPVWNIFLFLLCFFTFFHTHNHVFSGPHTPFCFYSCLLLFTQFSFAQSFSFGVYYYYYYCLIWFFVPGVCALLDEFLSWDIRILLVPFFVRDNY